jgi:hypothetical protein
VGSRLYAIGSKSLVQYNLDQLADTWHNNFGDDVGRQGLIGKDFVIVVCETPASNRPRIRSQSPPTLVLHAFSRAITDTSHHESGLISYLDRIASPTGIQSWQAVDGGLYYLTGDQKLFFLKGAKQ